MCIRDSPYSHPWARRMSACIWVSIPSAIPSRCIPLTSPLMPSVRALAWLSAVVRSCTNRRSSLTPVTGRSRSTDMEEYPVPKSSRWMPMPSRRRDARATWAESTRLRTAVSVTSITTRAGSTRCRARVSRTFRSQPGAASWTAETLDADRAGQVRTGGEHGAGLVQDLGADADDQSSFLGDVEELARAEQATGGVRPAHQCLMSDHVTVG